MNKRRPLARPEMLLGLTPDDLPLPDPDRVWAVLGADSADDSGSVDPVAVVTRLRALALVALDTATRIESLPTPTAARVAESIWNGVIGTDLVECAAEALGVHHARRAKEARDELRQRLRLAGMLIRVESELRALHAFLRGRDLLRPRIGRDRVEAVRAQARDSMAGRSDAERPVWTSCLADELGFEEVIRGKFIPQAVRQVVVSTGATREKVYAARRWCAKVWPEGLPGGGRLLLHLELVGPPRG